MEDASPYRPPRPLVPGGRGEEQDLLSELLEARLIASLATLNRDGTPHVVAIWYRWDGEALLMPTSARTRKIRNLERDPRATVMVDDSRGGLDLRGVTLVGRCEIVRGPVAVRLNREIHLRYLTAAGRELRAVDDYLSTDDVTIRFLPERASSWDLRRTPAGRALDESGAFLPLG